MGAVWGVTTARTVSTRFNCETAWGRGGVPCVGESTGVGTWAVSGNSEWQPVGRCVVAGVCSSNVRKGINVRGWGNHNKSVGGGGALWGGWAGGGGGRKGGVLGRNVPTWGQVGVIPPSAHQQCRNEGTWGWGWACARHSACGGCNRTPTPSFRPHCPTGGGTRYPLGSGSVSGVG